MRLIRTCLWLLLLLLLNWAYTNKVGPIENNLKPIENNFKPIENNIGPIKMIFGWMTYQNKGLSKIL